MGIADRIIVIRGLLADTNNKIHILQKIYKHYLDCNSSAPHGMKTKIFNNLTKNCTGICTESSFLLDF